MNYRDWIEDALHEGVNIRERNWMESVAVGGEPFVTATKEKLGIKGKWREVIGTDGFELREPTEPSWNI